MDRFETNTVVDDQGFVHIHAHVGSPGQTVHVCIDALPGKNATADAAALITHTPGVCGGRACIAGTRIAVWLLEALRRDGATDAYLLDQYPQLTEAHLAAAWHFVASHAADIDADISTQTHASDWPTPARSSVGAPAWLQRVYACVDAGNSDAGGEIVYDEMDQLLGDAKWQAADAVLAAVQLARLDPLTLVSLLTITGAARDHLRQRPGYFAAVRDRLALEMTPDRLQRVLVGLE